MLHLMGCQGARVIQNALCPCDGILAVGRGARNVWGLAVDIRRCGDHADGLHLDERADASALNLPAGCSRQTTTNWLPAEATAHSKLCMPGLLI